MTSFEEHIDNIVDNACSSLDTSKELVRINKEVKDLLKDIQEDIDESTADMNDTTSTSDADYHEGRIDAYELMKKRLEKIFL